MISPGRVSKLMAASTTSRKYKQREGENFTLGSVVNRLNVASEKMVANRAKMVILERLQQANTVRESVLTSGEVRDPHEVIFEMKSMRKSLQNQLKNDDYKTGSAEGRLKQFSTRKQTRGERGSSLKSLEKVSNSSTHRERFTKRNETEKKYCRKESLGTPSSTKKQMPSYPNGFTGNVYSRHMVIPTPRITVENNVDNYVQMDLGKNFPSPPCTALKNEAPTREIYPDNKLDLENSIYGSTEEASFIGSELEHGVSNPEAEPPPEEILLKEKEVLNRLTDPQLKESLQNIIKRRRSSVRFVKSESGYDKANLEKTVSEQQDETDDQYRQEQLEQLAVNDNTVQDSQNGDVRSAKSANSRQLSVNRERLTSAGTVTSERSHIPANSQQPRARTRKLAREEQRVPTARCISSARSCASTTLIQTQRSSSSPILRRRKPEIQTGETRFIRPATTKGYVPTLTYKKVLRKQSALSSPEISQYRHEAKHLAEVNVIREFLLMYAKVTAKKDETLPGRVPARMMSQTPEFVIKSAIGQFLTRAFPSGESEEWPELSSQSKKERYEEQQRSKLLRIKICMKHLASLT